MLSIALAGAIVIIILMALNRSELLRIVREKESVVDANTRAITKLESDCNLYIENGQKLEGQLIEVMKKLEQEKERNDKVVSQRISSQVKIGAISENALPFIQNMPYDFTNMHHLGQPVDFIYFDYSAEPSITLVEVKSGAAKESKRQKLIRDLIKEGKVHYDLVQITDQGVKITRKV